MPNMLRKTRDPFLKILLTLCWPSISPPPLFYPIFYKTLMEFANLSLAFTQGSRLWFSAVSAFDRRSLAHSNKYLPLAFLAIVISIVKILWATSLLRKSISYLFNSKQKA